LSEAEVIVGLGARTDYIATVPNADPDKLGLSADERAVLALVGRASPIGEVITRSDLPQARTIATLLALRAKGAVVPAKVNKPQQPAGPVSAALEEEIDLDPTRKKDILDLERIIDTANHFEVLGVRPGATPEESKKSFYELSRRYHPDRFFGKNLGSFRARIDRIFRRLTEAHRVLTNEEERAAYLKAHPALASAPPPAAAPSRAAAEPPTPRAPLDPVREAERRSRLSRHPYLAKGNKLKELTSRAKSHIANAEFDLAYTDLHNASQIDPHNEEVKGLLNQVRAKHEHQRADSEFKKGQELEKQGDFQAALAHYKQASNLEHKHGEAAFRAAKAVIKLGQDAMEARTFAQRAVDATPNNANYRAFLGQVLLDAGMKAMAKRQFEEALKINPNHEEAKKASKGKWFF
jgi:curved DNA-binding protein CbpA